MPVVVVGAAAGAAAGAGGGAAAAAGASAGAAGAGGGAATGAGASAGAGAGTGVAGAGGTGASAGTGSFGQTGAAGMPGGNSGSALGTKLKSNFGANAGDGLKAGANAVDGSVPGQNMSVSKSDAKAYDRYKDRAKDIKDNVDRARDVKDTLFSDEGEEEDGTDYVPDAESLKKARKSKGASGKMGKLAALMVVLFVFLICAPAAVITAPISIAKGISKTFLGSSEFSSLVSGGGAPGIGTVVNATKYFTLIYQLIDGMEEKDFKGTSMSKETMLELVRLSESSYDDSIYQFVVEYIEKEESYEVEVGKEPVYGDVIKDKDGNPVLDEDGNEVKEIIEYKPIMETRWRNVYATRDFSLDMKEYVAEYYVPWELSYAIAVASDFLGKGSLSVSPEEDVFETGLIYDITDALRADIEFHTDYRVVYYNKVAEHLHGTGFMGTSVKVPISYLELYNKSHSVIKDVKEGYLPRVIETKVSSYLYDYDFYWGYDLEKGGHYNELVTVKMNPDKLKKVIEEQGLTRSGKVYMLEILLGLNREDLARSVDAALEIGYNFD